MNKSELQWWKDKLHDYEELESLDVAEVIRLILCCLEFIVKGLDNDN